ncbi:hypothetical protein Ocin01_03482 [Orchesella cincta]|uniref:Uncharacterized protein n=1 Tax=Orchesella cincta TaxID=48709 RepID=A0A1D2ND85_ORCCI|nr:hypothetical protein Ocin01_03482 [Orchesella cincta]
MRTLTAVVVISIVLLEIHHLLVMGEVKEKSCRATVQDITKLQLQLLAVCSKELKFKNGKEKSKKTNISSKCILRCAMIKAELTGKDGQITAESVDYLLHKFMPPSLIDKANKTFYPCMEIGLKEKFKTVEEDEFCLTYDPFIKCFMQNAQTFCA